MNVGCCSSIFLNSADTWFRSLIRSWAWYKRACKHDQNSCQRTVTYLLTYLVEQWSVTKEEGFSPSLLGQRHINNIQVWWYQFDLDLQWTHSCEVGTTLQSLSSIYYRTVNRAQDWGGNDLTHEELANTSASSSHDDSFPLEKHANKGNKVLLPIGLRETCLNKVFVHLVFIGVWFIRCITQWE